ncbi:response regulator transcription factor [Corynebacterium sp. H78]|uniref:response regulator transcription factor n=1 Tax=Corynebacterium sp. H78 TaxID=3133417 RepID=UPI00309A6333
MKIIIADDSALLREGVAGLVEKRGHEVLAKVDSANALVEAVDSAWEATGTLPDLVITDVRMPPTMQDDGLRAAVELRETYPDLNVLVLSQYVAPAYARELFSGDKNRAGTGYLLKDRVSHVIDFLGSLDVVAGGGVVIDPDVATALMRSGHSGLAELTAREREVLELMARGLSNTQIAETLVLSAASVAKHVSNIFVKLRLQPGEENRRVRAILEYLTETTGQI